MDTALNIQQTETANDFRTYLEESLRNPFSVNLDGCSLMEVVRACVRAKSRQRPKYANSISSMIYNLRLLEERYFVTLQPVQVTDIFWNYFIAFCKGRGMKESSVNVICNQLRTVLNWAVKYNATVSPTYADFKIRVQQGQQIALTADEVSRITYFDIERFYNGFRKDYRKTMERVRDMFVLSCNLFQRHSDMVRIGPECFDRGVFRIRQQKTGNLAVVNIDKYSIEPKTTHRILEKYGYTAPYKATIGNYNYHLHILLRDIGIDDPVRLEERDASGRMVSRTVPKYELVSSHTARRTAITVGTFRGINMHELRVCSGHSDLRIFDRYIRDEH